MDNETAIKKEIQALINILKPAMKIQFDGKRVPFQKFKGYMDLFYPYKLTAGYRKDTWDAMIRGVYSYLRSSNLIRRGWAEEFFIIKTTIRRFLTWLWSSIMGSLK